MLPRGLVALSLAHAAVGFVRQRYQSRTFNPLCASIAAELVQQQRGAGVHVASLSGRADLAAEYVEFLDVDIPMPISAGFTVIGSLGIVGRRWVRLADTEAASWGTVEVLSVGLWVFTLARVTSEAIDVGAVIAMIACVAFYTAGFYEVQGAPTPERHQTPPLRPRLRHASRPRTVIRSGRSRPSPTDAERNNATVEPPLATRPTRSSSKGLGR